MLTYLLITSISFFGLIVLYYLIYIKPQKEITQPNLPKTETLEVKIGQNLINKKKILINNDIQDLSDKDIFDFSIKISDIILNKIDTNIINSVEKIKDKVYLNVNNIKPLYINS